MSETSSPAAAAPQTRGADAPKRTRNAEKTKAAILVAVRAGVITREEASRRYLLSKEELAGWEAAFDRAGIPGLLAKAHATVPVVWTASGEA